MQQALKVRSKVYRPRKPSARKPPRRQSMKEVPRKLVTVFADVAFPKCITPVKYVTKLNAIPSVISLSLVSTPKNRTEQNKTVTPLKFTLEMYVN